MNGIINIYKEAGYTSFDVVAKLRGILHEKKIGHTGTLDPDAVGVLLVCIGSATKVCGLLTDKDKEYEAVLQLGVNTDTQDASGKIVRDRSALLAGLDETRVREAVERFIGAYEQVPPMYSALKVGGKKLCDLARAGVEVERRARTVHIYEIEIMQVQLPLVTMRVHCSKGTYIRTLCEDVGEALGVGGMMKSLVRTRVSNFTLAQAATLAQVEAHRDAGTLEELLLPVDAVFADMSALRANASAKVRLCNGNRLSAGDFSDAPAGKPEGEMRFRVYDDAGKFCAVYSYDAARGDFKCVKMFL